MASKRRYCTIADVQELANVTSTNDTEFEDRISQAEELIDAYIGFQNQSVARESRGVVTSVAGTTIVDNSNDTPFDIQNDYFNYCRIQVIGGTGAGQDRAITGSSKDGKSITVDTAFSPQLDNTSVYRIYQLGKFPRYKKDVYYEPTGLHYYKSIPEAVRRATAAQVQFMIEMGDEYFAGEDPEMDGERILNYSYQRGAGGASQTSIVKMVSPKARALLRGYKNSKGELQAENPTWL